MHNFLNLPFDSNPCHQEIQLYKMYNGTVPIFNSRKPWAFDDINKSVSIYLFFWSSLDTNIEASCWDYKAIFFPIYPRAFHIMQL